MYFQYHLSYYTRLSIHIQAENKLINKKIYVYKSKIYGKIYNEELIMRTLSRWNKLYVKPVSLFYSQIIIALIKLNIYSERHDIS